MLKTLRSEQRSVWTVSCISVLTFLHVKPGKGNTFMRTKLKDVVDGYVLERRFNIGEKLEDVRVERRPYQFFIKKVKIISS